MNCLSSGRSILSCQGLGGMCQQAVGDPNQQLNPNPLKKEIKNPRLRLCHTVMAPSVVFLIEPERAMSITDFVPRLP